MNQQKIDPCLDGIRSHACIRHIPQWPDNSPRMEQLRHEIQATGIVPPILMTSKHEIVDADSRERWRAAKALQLDCIPVHIVADADIVSASLNVLIHRRHLTKSALAYLAFPLVKPALEEAQARAREKLKNANVSSSDAQRRTAKTVEEIAEGLGIGTTFLKDARRVHEIFTKDAAFKAQMEPRLLCEPIGGEHEQNRPVGLGAIIAGYAGKANEDKARNDRSQLELFRASMKSFCIRAPQIEDEAAARKIVREQLENMDAEELESVQRTAAMVVGEAVKLAKGAAK
jgi:hypothetical protein